MKIGLLITARLKSSRLPQKLLLDIHGKTLISRVIERAKRVQGVSEIVLCSSTNSQDKPLTNICLKENIHYYLGSEEDVLQRLLDAAEFFSMDYILSITGENPLFSIEYANRIVDQITKQHSDFVTINGLPIGCAIYGIRVAAVKTVCAFKPDLDTEIWGPLIDRKEIFKVHKIEPHPFFNRPNLRITTDYFEDYEFINKIFSHFGIMEIPSLYQALKILDEHPEYLEINSKREQAGIGSKDIERINKYYKKNLKEILDFKKRVYYN